MLNLNLLNVFPHARGCDDGREHFVKHSPAEVTDKICAANKELGGLKL